ncbi:glycosyltransferase family 1 protein [Aquisalimonas sp.]|uniref:glycosyltransferase family 4 protein n=1 Tax=unclassified Aquisalimonas TaxID=2644645 RepID=UPI0025B8758E|nr:glycosyltransferase family 1 protein [Aquisalimonas sp.]
MRIALVTETYRPETNGVAMTLGRLVDYVQRHGHRVELVTPTLRREDVPAGLSLLTLPGLPLPGYPEVRFGLPAVRRLVGEWGRHRPDVIYVATQGPLGWAAVRAARRLGLPVISGYHTHFSAYGQHYGLALAAPLVDSYLRRFHRRTRLTLAPTRQLAAQLQEAGFGDVEVLARGVDTQLFHPQRRDQGLRREWGMLPGSPVVLYVGRIAAEKNLELAVRAFLAIQRSSPTARFVLVGDGPLKARLAAENPDFVFTGSQSGEALAQHYASADLFLFPSLTDTFGNVVLEAMASGLPVVAFDHGAAAEHITPFSNGVSAPFGNADRFVALSILLARETALRHRFGALARSTVNTLDWDTVGARFTALLTGQAHRRGRELPPGPRPLEAVG